MAAQYPWDMFVVHPAYVCSHEMPPGQTVQVAFDSLSVPPFFRSGGFFGGFCFFFFSKLPREYLQKGIFCHLFSKCRGGGGMTPLQRKFRVLK